MDALNPGPRKASWGGNLRLGFEADLVVSPLSRLFVIAGKCVLLLQLVLLYEYNNFFYLYLCDAFR
jgi:hypothetical protein